MERFSPAVADWFRASFAEPTPAQALGWPAISAGQHTLILAPTGSGKTLAAFLWGIDRLVSEPVPDRAHRCRLLYISPLRALAVDVEKNLRSPLRGIAAAAERLDLDIHEPVVGVRTGDTPSKERQALIRHPPDILITTPESLYLMLTSRARETLAGVQWVIVDEIHAMAATKRGSHLAVSLERLEELTDRSPQRIGLSATQRPMEEIAAFLGGSTAEGRRPVEIVDAGSGKELDIEVVVGVEDMGDLGSTDDESGVRGSIWPSIHPRLLELVLSHRSTLIFCNARRLAERLATRLNELYLGDEAKGNEFDGSSPPEGRELVRAHHGSLSREQRLRIEDDLKSGRLRGLVATSSLELGIDMGAVDLVVQVESPGAVGRGLQRIGRAGHQVGAPSVGKLFPKHRGDLVEAAVVVERMHDGLVESTRYPRNPLDVLAQQIVAMCAVDEWDVDGLFAVVGRAAPFSELSREVFESVLDLLAGRYPSDEFAGLRARVNWDRVDGRVTARSGAGRIAVTNGGTIPDRGLFGVFLPDGTRVGELDEEMVYESRAGETFLLGASTWRIAEIGFDRVIVTPAPGEPGKMPFWHGDAPGRPLELGRALGAFTRQILEAPPGDAIDRLSTRSGFDDLAARNLISYLHEQREATGAVPDDRTVVVERFRDEIGDWRVCLLSPFGATVHAPWAIALRARLEERFGSPVEALWSDDGIVLRLPEAFEEVDLDDLLPSPEEVRDLVVAHLPGTSLYASRFREVAGRALLLPRRRPGERTPLWQQRQRAADLLEVAAGHPGFPMLLETTRECVQDVFDLPSLQQVLGEIRSRVVRVVQVDTGHASPFAQSLLFGWIAQYMYEGDAPLAERRAAALALDRDLLEELLGAEELRELLDGAAMADLELELQHLADGYRARDVDRLEDVLRDVGPLDAGEVAARCDGDADSWIDQLVGQRRVIEVRIAGSDRYAAAEDAGRLRDALGVALPLGLPAAFTDPVDDPLVELVARYARTHAPFLTKEVASHLGESESKVERALNRLVETGRLIRGEFRPDGHRREWCDVGVLRVLRRRSLAVLRAEVEPVDGRALARFLPAWHGIDSPGHGTDALIGALERLQGAAIPASVLERDVLGARVQEYRPSDLDALLSSGAVVWTGAGSLGPRDGRVRLCFREHAGLLLDRPEPEGPQSPVHDAIRAHLASSGASFWPDLVRAAGTADEAVLLPALWDLVWAGEVTNDTFAPLRALVGRSRGRGRSARRPRPGRLQRLGPPAGGGRWSLVEPLLDSRATPTEMAHARARQLLERHGVVTREAVLAEGLVGGFASVYGVLRALEDRGQVRRGYFVAGLGAAQFALAGAVDRLRSHRRGGDGQGLVMAATDPAQPFGAALAWPDSPGRPQRKAGAFVVMADGSPLVHLDGSALSTFEGAADLTWVEPLRGLITGGRLSKIEIRRIDGTEWSSSEWTDKLTEAGFSAGYRGPTLR